MGWINAALKLAPTILSVGSSLISNNSASKNLAAQQQQNAQTKQIADDQLAFAKELNKQGLATQIDASGNITYYDKASNTWHSVLSPKQQQLQDLSDTETKNQLSIDAPIQRSENLVDAIRRSKEGTTADALRYQLKDQIGQPAFSGDRLASSLRLAREGAVNKGFDTISSQVGTQALRSGAGAGGALAASLAKAKSQQIAQVMGNPDIEGMQLAEDMNSNRTSNLLNNYNTMAGRASNAPQTNYNPIGLGSGLAATLAGARSGALQSGGTSANISANAASVLNGMKIPNYAQGDGSGLLAGLSSLLGSGAGSDLISTITGMRKKATTTPSWNPDDGA